MLFLAASVEGQFTPPRRASAALAGADAPPVTLPPATKLEAFKPSAGSVVTVGYDVLDRMGRGAVAIQIREMKDQRSNSSVRGLVVDVDESEYRSERAFVDVDELPELAQALDAFLELQKNPTSYKEFEVRYHTRGDLQITAFNSPLGGIRFMVQVGRVLKSSASIDREELGRFRKLLDIAQAKLAAAQ